LLPKILAVVVVGLSLGTPTIADDLDLDAVRSMIEDGQTASALELLDQEIASSTADSAALRFLRARVLVTMGNLEEAEHVYRELITRYPARPEPYNNLAHLYSAQGKLDQAASLLRAGLYTDPSYRALFDNLTRIYAEQAARSLSAALDPEDAELRKALPLGTLSEIPTLLD
jgi:Flp pilus assembly protein TadD|tara:strand:- start:188 stop:703 length:516 start_codon:yes stop_codon:yes gene_type:complete